jgi:uncharacterized BrkB/YihY/UPF0761 family membrane protein
MMLALHISVALASLVFSTYLLIAPTKNKFKLSFSLIGATLASGTILVLANLSHLVSACVTGLVYLSCVLALNAYAYNKLATQENNK